VFFTVDSPIPTSRKIDLYSNYRKGITRKFLRKKDHGDSEFVRIIETFELREVQLY